jgi:hypothetical protein
LNSSLQNPSNLWRFQLQENPFPGLVGNVAGRITKQKEEITRYPTIETQGQVTVGEEFSVLVSLTEEEITPEVEITQGTMTQSGQLDLSLPDQGPWKIEVALFAEGFTFRDNNDTAKIELPHEGDSTPAIFHLTPQPIERPTQIRKLYATFWHQGKFLARRRNHGIRHPT